MKLNLTVRLFSRVILIFIVLSGCKSYNIRPNISREERLTLATTMFQKKDYLEAKTQFRILILNNPGARFIDQAQYFLAESHFQLKEYILAADEFSRLSRLYPKSAWIDDAQYKIALCDFKLSPKASLDQKYTTLAVLNFQSFLEDFPNSELVPEAEKMLKTCRTKLSEKDYKNGKLYIKLKDYYAALVYFNGVLDNYYDTEYAGSALYWKGECLYKLNRNSEAATVFKELLKKYPKSNYRYKVNQRLKDIEIKLNKNHQTNAKQPLSKPTNN